MFDWLAISDQARERWSEPEFRFELDQIDEHNAVWVCQCDREHAPAGLCEVGR